MHCICFRPENLISSDPSPCTHFRWECLRSGIRNSTFTACPTTDSCGLTHLWTAAVGSEARCCHYQGKTPKPSSPSPLRYAFYQSYEGVRCSPSTCSYSIQPPVFSGFSNKRCHNLSGFLLVLVWSCLLRRPCWVSIGVRETFRTAWLGSLSSDSSWEHRWQRSRDDTTSKYCALPKSSSLDDGSSSSPAGSNSLPLLMGVGTILIDLGH